MNDLLKNFIHQNRADFDDKLPSDKVWKQVERSLPKMERISLWNSVTVWRAAALAFFCLSIYFLVTRANPTSKIQITQQKEFTDLELYYSNEIAEKVEFINNFDEEGENGQITQDFQKLEAMYQVLREEMKARPSAKVKEALVLNLLVRIDLLNQQIEKLEDIGKSNKQKVSI